MNFKNKLLSSSRITKQFLVALTDLGSFSFAAVLACLVSNLDLLNISLTELLRIAWIPFFSVLVFYFFGVYRSVLRYIDFALIYLLFKALIVAFLLNLKRFPAIFLPTLLPKFRQITMVHYQELKILY